MTDQDAGSGTPGSAAAAALGSPPPAPAFHESFTDAGVKEWASKSGFKSAEDVAKLAHKFDAFKDADPASLAILPKDPDTKAHMALLERLGAPKEANAYALDKIEGVDAELATAASSWFKEAGILPWQATLLAQKQMEHAKAQQEAIAAAEKADAARELAALRTEWQGEYDAKIEMGRRAAKAMGFTTEEIAYLESGAGVGKVLSGLAKLGALIKEGDFIDGPQGQNQPVNILQQQYPKDYERDLTRQRR